MDSKKPEFSTDLGVVSVSNEVVSVAAGLAASSVEGVAAMAGGWGTGLIERLGRKNLQKGVSVDTVGENTIIDIYIVVEFGYTIKNVAEEVQKAVKTAVENMTGLTLGAVNVHVVSVMSRQEAEAEAEAEAEEAVQVQVD